jgi:transglutaminase-like putative cysteine protease
MSRLHVVHRTTFVYTAPVSASYNEARMQPLALPGQIVLDSRVVVEPATWSTEYRDYWGTLVTAFEVLEPHSSLAITAESRVEVAGTQPESPGCGWDTLGAPGFTDRYAEFLGSSPATDPDPALVDLARSAATGLAPPSAARAVCEAVRSEIRYIPGVTGTPSRRGPSGRASARTSPTSPSGRCVPSASPLATSPDTSTRRRRTPRSGRR